jgi:PP-loop superfamily ATP-utilizing enzyme
MAKSEHVSRETLSPLQEQDRAKRRTGYGAIALRRHGDYAVVEVEGPYGVWVEVIREHIEDNFSHIVEPRGIEAIMFIGDNYAPSR